MNEAPPIQTLPPVVLVKTWIMLTKDKAADMQYARKRAIDIIALIFGSVEAAKQYIAENEKTYSQDKHVSNG